MKKADKIKLWEDWNRLNEAILSVTAAQPSELSFRVARMMEARVVLNKSMNRMLSDIEELTDLHTEQKTVGKN